MEPLFQFTHLDMRRCWPTSDEAWIRYATQAIPAASAADRPLSPLGRLPAVQALHDPCVALQVCLLALELFQGCADDEVCDMRWTPPTIFRCQNRPALIKALATALLTYERELCAIREFFSTLPEAMRSGLADIGIARNIFMDLHKRERIARRRDVTPALVDGSLWVLRRMLDGLPHEEYLKGARPTEMVLKNTLAEEMGRAFTDYGPDAPSYPAIAAGASVALILAAFGLEAGTPGAIAERLRKRLARAKPRTPSQ